ncbi:hypothetical protein HPB51_000849 [Rhipicephalus microplus]|uniref:Uncharacterized protein n=1 Tax=Rhipicephalus microplus TaxID=6941 RepID=A0A9J6D8Y6_RHIMP|nr:hypothetical protein HPB51_000849 [Rhipicephalus microplus]
MENDTRFPDLDESYPDEQPGNCDTPSNESKEDRDDDSTFAAVKLLLKPTTNSSDEDDDDEDEELEPGLGYDFAAEDLTSTALPPAADDPSIVAVSTFKSQGLQDGAWPQPPDNTEVFHAVTTTAVCKHAKMDDTPHVEEKSAGHAVAELELLVSHLAEKTTTLSKAALGMVLKWHNFPLQLLSHPSRDDEELGTGVVQQSRYGVGQVTPKPVKHKHQTKPQLCSEPSTPQGLYPVKH